MHVALVGLGEVGRCFVEPLRKEGYRLSLCESRPSPAAVDLSQRVGIAIQPGIGDWLQEADWVLSCVTGSVARDVVAKIVPCLRSGAAIADFTTASPAVKREAAALCAAADVQYLDVAIMGGILSGRERTPLLVSGEPADRFVQLMEPAGARVKTIPAGAAGDAMALKILRSVFTKGMEALSVELLMSAEKQGVREQLYDQLQDIDQTPLRDFIEMLVRSHVVHAKRRAHEVHDAQQELAQQGLASAVLPGVERRFHRTAAALDAHPHALPEPDIGQALGWLLAHGH